MKPNPLSADLLHVLDHTRDLWEDLRGMRLFITGGTGFFGCWILESFLFANQHLNLKASASVLTRRPDAVKQMLPHLTLNSAITLVGGDVRNFAFPKGEYSHIIHAATDASAKLNNENPLLMLDTVIDGTRHMLNFSVHCKSEKFLLTSSGAVYGRQPSNMTRIPEEYMGAPDSLDPHSAYGIGKRTAEHLCALYAKQHGVFATIARCFAFIGPYLPLDIHFAVGNFIYDAMNGAPIIIKGDGTPRRSYLYAADLAIWLWAILLRGETGRAYNVGSEEDLSIVEVARVVSQNAHPQSQIEIRGIPNFALPVEQYVPSTQRAQNELGLTQTVSLDEGIKRTIAYLQGQDK